MVWGNDEQMILENILNIKPAFTIPSSPTRQIHGADDSTIKIFHALLIKNVFIDMAAGRWTYMVRSEYWVKVQRADTILGGCGQIDPRGRIEVDG